MGRRDHRLRRDNLDEMTEASGSKVLSRSRVRRVRVYAIAGLAGIVAIAAGSAPTGLAVWDAFLRAALAALVVVAVARGPRWVAIVLAVIAAGAAGLTAWVIPAWGALIIAVAPIALPKRSRLLAALSAAIAVQVLLRLPEFGFFGLPSLIAGAGCVVCLVMGYRSATGPGRRRVRWAVGIVVLLLGIVGTVAGLMLVSVRGDVEQGIDAARRGLEAARLADSDTVVVELEQADQLLSAAADRVHSPLMQPIRLVPIAAQHYQALESATTQGALVASEAAATVRTADLQLVSLDAGSVDLGVLTSMAPRLASTAAVMRGVPAELEAASSPWLLPVLRDRIDELAEEVTKLQPEADLAALSAEVVPGLLGSESERRYVVLFGTPAESREFGGFIGSWALVRVADGRLEVERAERIRTLYPLAASNVLDEADLPTWYVEMAQPTVYPQNLTSTPDFGVVSRVAHQVLAGIADRPVDGYVYMDTWAVVQMLSLTGPIALESDAELLTQADVAEFLFFDQYRLGGADRNDLFDELARVASAAVGDPESLTLPRPEELGRVLGPVSRAGRLQMVTFDDRENEFLRAVTLLRDFDQGDAQDFVGVVQTNSVESKLDLYLHRELEYDVSVSATGDLSATASVELRSLIPEDAPRFTLGAGDATARPLLSLYTPHLVREVRVNGESVSFATSLEFGFQRFLVEVPVPASGEPVTVEYVVSGRVDPTVAYDLKVWHQPLVNNDEVRVTYDGIGENFDHRIELVENMTFSSDGAAQE